MNADGIATVHVTKAEIGQHVGTALAQAVAEELEIDWNDVRVNYPESHAKWGLHITGCSWSVAYFSAKSAYCACVAVPVNKFATKFPEPSLTATVLLVAAVEAER